MALTEYSRNRSSTLSRWGLAMALPIAAALFLIVRPTPASAETLSNSEFEIQTGLHGEISSIKLKGDTVPTEYVMNQANMPTQNSVDHQWLGELMFTYKLGDGGWTKAWTNKSADARSIDKNENSVTVTYENASNPEGIRNFKVVETYSLLDDAVKWEIGVTNTSSQPLEIGDFGLPLPFNEFWNGGDAIYETRVVTHSYVGNNSSYITAQRPSGVGPYLLLAPDASTGAGFEYQDRWKKEEHPGSVWSDNEAINGGWPEGLNVFYIHSNAIKSTNKGYLPNTSLNLAPGASKTYAFKFFKVADENAMKEKLYEEGLLDVTVVPGMIVPTNQKAKFDLHTTKAIQSVTAQYPGETTIVSLGSKPGDHHLYELTISRLGQNDITVEYGNGEKAVLQFYAIEPIDQALQRHATFMVEKTQYQLPGDIRDQVFDDWMMQKSGTDRKRNSFAGYWGWGDDWGLTHGQFLAEKNALSPVGSEVTAVDRYLETAIWNQLMIGHHEDYLVPDFLMPQPNTTPLYRGYAYPHIYNTYFSMYKIAKLYPELVDYIHEPNIYLLRAYNILKALYDGPVSYNWNTGLMGELTTPDIIQALKDEGYITEANDVIAKMSKKYDNFKNTKYPYGSEYSYDNTGEEAVYTLAKMNGNATMMGKINAKTRASRGHMPVWYYYADPVTITGENWWNFQYTTSLAGYAMDDWIRNRSANAEVEQRLSYAAKIANIGSINSGQISSDPNNIGAASWTYQAEKGNFGALGLDGGPLFNGWRGMTGEADLGLFGAIKILSADIAVDPLFGLVGYGAEVTLNGSNYEITPLDGVFKRLNLITEKLGLELSRDQYMSAVISKNKNYVHLEMKSLTPGKAHQMKIKFTGLKKATYNVTVNGVSKGKFNAYRPTAELTVDAGTAEAYTVELTEGTPDPNQAPVVDAGADTNVTLPDGFVLYGSASDDDLPAGTLSTVWSVVSKPEGATAAIDSPDSLSTTVSLSAPGTYVFKLTANDSELTAEDTVTVTVAPAPPLPELLVRYAFDEDAGATAADSSGSGNDGTVYGTAAWTAGKKGNAVSLNGNNAYIKLPSGIANRADEVTIAAWVKANSLNDYVRIFDFGSGTSTYMFLTPKAGNSMRFAISTNGNAPGAEQMINGPALPVGVWKHVAVTISGSTGILYVDGIEVGRNDEMTLKPSSLGKTMNNYIGKSQFTDPYLNGLVDDFRIYSRALSAAEIGALVAPPADDIQSVEEPQVTTPAGKAPKLPATVRAELKDGTTIEVAVAWDAVDPALYSTPGNAFVANGIVVGTSLTTKAHVTVTEIQIDPFPSLVVRYNFDESSGSVAADSSGNGRDGTLTGTLAWNAAGGHQAGALGFAGSGGNYVNAGTDGALQPKNITVSYWIKRTGDMNASENMLLWFKPERDWAGNGLFITYNGISSIVLVDGTGSFFVEQSPNDFLPLNEWTNVVVTFNSDTNEAAIYKNGVAQEIGTDGTVDSITATDSVKRIGVSGYSDGAQLNAQLDDFRIYDGTMTAKQVLAIYSGKDVKSVQAVAATTKAGVAPALPQIVTVVYEDGSQGTAAVKWDAIDPAQYANPGVAFEAGGSVDGTKLRATAIVTVTVNDTTPPSIVFAGQSVYTIDQEILITCTATDDQSGVASSSCDGPLTAAHAYELEPGNHVVSAEAVDHAGNHGSAQFTFTVQVTFDSLAALTDAFIAEKGAPGSGGIANALKQKLANAKAAWEKGTAKEANDQLTAYLNQVSAQKGKALSEAQASILDRWAKLLAAAIPQM